MHYVHFLQGHGLNFSLKDQALFNPFTMITDKTNV